MSSIATHRGVFNLMWVLVASNASEEEEKHCIEHQYVDVDIGRHGDRLDLRIENFEC